MSDPRRLLFDDQASEFARDLVRSWDDVRPDDEGRKKTLASLGIAGVVSTAIVAGTTTAAAGGSLAPKAVAGGVAWLKWMALGLVVAGAAIVGAMAASHRDAAVTVGEAASAGAPARGAALAPLAEAPSALPTPSVAPAPPVVTPSALPNASARHAEPTRASPAAPTASLDEQLAALDRARAALDDGNATRAQSLVDDYETRYRDGAFLQEAEVLRIQALLKSGDRAAAERAGQRFLAAYPKSPHAARVRSLLAAPR